MVESKAERNSFLTSEIFVNSTQTKNEVYSNAK